MFHFTFKNDFLEEYGIHLYLLTPIYEIFKFLENFGIFFIALYLLGYKNNFAYLNLNVGMKKELKSIAFKT